MARVLEGDKYLQFRKNSQIYMNTTLSLLIMKDPLLRKMVIEVPSKTHKDRILSLQINKGII